MIDERYRRLTPREAARIQSFPETFTLDTVSENRQYRAIGNAVPPVLMWQVANALTKSLLTDTPIKVKERKNILTEA
jgi:DNA (cytosine-5)-methyltransferase 1